MTSFSDFTKYAAIAMAITCVAVPTMSLAELGFDSGGNGPDEPGPGDWGGPDGFAAPEGGGGGGVSAPTGGSGNSIVSQRINECANGNLIVDFDFDSDGHPIPASFTRTCVPFR